MYLEIVTPDVASTCGLYEAMHGVNFGPEDADLGGAKTAEWTGTLSGIRQPLADHEKPIVRTYLAVKDIHGAVTAAEKAGAIVAYPPTKQGDHGIFSIIIHDGVEHGLWQQP